MEVERMAKREQNFKSRFHKGTNPIPDSDFVVETVVNGEIVKLGTVHVSGKIVAEEIESYQSIKGHEPHDVAKRLAYEKFPKANPIILSIGGE